MWIPQFAAHNPYQALGAKAFELPPNLVQALQKQMHQAANDPLAGAAPPGSSLSRSLSGAGAGSNLSAYLNLSSSNAGAGSALGPRRNSGSFSLGAFGQLQPLQHGDSLAGAMKPPIAARA